MPRRIECEYNLGPPYPKQQEILSYLMTPEPGRTKLVDVECGRGFGKTTLAIEFATRAMTRDKNQRILFLEPDVLRLQEAFLAEWHRIVPTELYDIEYGKRRIFWKNGAQLRYGHRDIRGNKARRARMLVGPNISGVIDDEAAEGFHREQQQNTFNCIRLNCDILFYLTITTPFVGEYSRYIKEPGHRLFRGTSYDNVYLSRSIIDGWIANMHSHDQVRREIYGEEVSLEGRIFKGAKIDAVGAEHDPENRWPRGNVHWDFSCFRPELPWWLFCDLGSATGAFVVVQKAPGSETWVAVADYCSNDDANASRAFQRLDDEFGRPSLVVGGADIHTKNSVDGTTVAYFASQTWGNVPIRAMGESFADKQQQFDILSRLIYTLDGTRRFCVAKDFASLAPETHRGVREALLEYSMRPIEERREGEFLPKGSDQPLCHVADAMLMGAPVMAPPSFLKKRERTG